MSVEYVLINKSKKEKIDFCHLPAGKAKELCGNPVTSAITTWYLLQNSGDEIGFVPEQGEILLKGIDEEDTWEYTDVTEQVIEQLIKNGILKDCGKEIFDEDEPEVYIRKLKNIWMD